MLIFDDCLRIIFKDNGSYLSDDRKTGIIRCRLYSGGETGGYKYLVYVYKDGELSDKTYVSDSQILQVWIKDTDGFGVWVNRKDLYASYPNGTIIKPNTIYNYIVKSGVRKSGRYPFESNALKETINSAYGYFAANYIANDEKVVKDAMWEWKMTPKKVIFNGPATIVMWQDGSKTVVKKSEDDTDDREKAVMYAIFKKEFCSRAKMNRYLKLFKEVESNEKKEN